MHRNRSLMCWMGAVALLGGCQPAAETAEQADQRMSAESAAAKTAIEASNAQFAAHFNAGHGDSVAAIYADNGRVLAPNTPAVSGRAAITAFMATMAPMKPALTLTTQSVAANGPLAVEMGTYSFTMTPPGAPAPITDTGKYLVHWHKVGDKWMMVDDIWNSDLPAMAEPPKEPPKKN
jgi:ketosteroid isomerase-like protein